MVGCLNFLKVVLDPPSWSFLLPQFGGGPVFLPPTSIVVHDFSFFETLLYLLFISFQMYRLIKCEAFCCVFAPYSPKPMYDGVSIIDRLIVFRSICYTCIKLGSGRPAYSRAFLAEFPHV